MARLEEQEKQAIIETQKAEILEKRANAAKSRAEAENLAGESQKQRLEVERMQLENEKLRIGIRRAKVQLALDILNQVAPNLAETERIDYLTRLLPALESIITSDLNIESAPT